MPAITLTITNAGRAALVDAASAGTFAVRIASAGLTASSFTPLATATSLPGEFARITGIAGAAVDPDTITLNIRDDSNAVYTLRGLGLFLADGTLFAIYSQSAAILEKSANSTTLIVLDVRFADLAATSLTFGNANFLNPPATTSVQGVIEIATNAEALTGADSVRALVPAALKHVLDNRFGADSASAFVKTLLTAVNAAAFRVLLSIKSAALKDEGHLNGLDADLLDGQHGSFYTNITARLGYTPWHAGNDGSGSGLDADLLDGQDSGFFTNIPARLGFNPVNRAGDTMTGNLTVPVLLTSSSGDGQNVGIGNDVWLGDVDFENTVNVRGRQNPASGYISFGTGAARLGADGTTILRFNGHVVWHAGNDGAGSGLDADLLDGQDGAFYTNIPARLGFTPVNRAGDTMTGDLTVPSIITTANATRQNVRIGDDAWLGDNNLADTVFVTGVTNPSHGYMNFGTGTARLGAAGNSNLTFNGNAVWHAGNDGAGSGLDADLLDGLPTHNVATAQIGGPWPSIPIINSTGVIEAGRYIDFHSSPNDPNDFTNRLGLDDSGRFFVNGGILWHAGNDGAGSGLDADLLDGRDATSFADASHGHSASDIAGAFTGSAQQLANDGWQLLPGGLLMQWGRNRTAVTGETSVAFAFPRAFSGEPFMMQATSVNPGAANNRDMYPELQYRDSGGAIIRWQQPDSGGSRPADGFDWFAIGLAGTGAGAVPGGGGGGGGGGEEV